MINIPSENRFGFDCLLFEACNLNCTFCLEAHNNTKIDYDWIQSIPLRLVERFKKEYVKFPNTKLITIRLWGGELFYDALPDSIFQVYTDLVQSFITEFGIVFPNITLSFAWVSNGVFTKTERLIKLLKNTNSLLNISYDPVGRYKTKKQEELMLANCKLFTDLNLLDEISITLTKPNIQAYITNKARLSDLNFIKKIDINYYIPNPLWKELLPNDEDLFMFFKWCADNRFFTILDFKRVLDTLTKPNEKVELVCNCHKHLSACKDCITYNCVTSSSILPQDLFYDKYTNEINEDNVSDIKRKLSLHKRGCLFCEYANICPKICWTSILFKEYTATECPMQRLYKYLQDNKQILEDYKKWSY